ncbi:MAG: NADH-quinone oxidoreductase subunit N [Pirellulales bacterium]|nr:NADH-quinone oxidoreductase subunit N [Pirellulales bacterium]
MPNEAIAQLMPEIVLAAAAVAIYMAGAFVASRRAWRPAAGAAIVAAAAALGLQSSVGPMGTLAGDAFGQILRWTVLAAGFILVLMACRATRDAAPEFFGSLLLAVAGAMLASGAGELILLFVALELVSIPTYLLLFVGRSDAASEEATTKYFFLSVLSSAILLYGLSFLYGAAGSTDLATIARQLAEAPGETVDLAKIALALVVAGLALKIAAVPFHFYAPDVYQGTTHLGAAFLSVVPKIAGFAALARLLLAMPGAADFGWRAVAVLAVASMTLANAMALWQTNLRRLLAYSSIAHTGFLLAALAAGLAADAPGGAWDGIAAMLFYLCVYALGTLGTFAALVHLGGSDGTIDNVEELAGLGKTCPWIAGALAVCLFSLTGIPPLAGFWGKLVVVAAALDVRPSADAASAGVRAWFIALAVLSVLNAAVAAAYYLRIVAVLYFRIPLATPRRTRRGGAWSAAAACAMLVVLVGLWSGPLLGECRRARPGVTPATQVDRNDVPTLNSSS